MKHATYNTREKGVALYLTVVILAVLMAGLLVLIGISVSQIKVIQTTGNSVIAFGAADSGIEKYLYEFLKKGSYTPVLYDCPYNGYLDLNNNGSQDSNDSTYQVCVSDISTSTVWSTGSYKKTKRRIEINF